MAVLYGRAGRLTAQNGGFWPGQAGWYLDQVLPKEFGVRQPWYFPLEYFIKLFKGQPIAPAEGQDTGVADVEGTVLDVEPVSIKLRQQEQKGNCVNIKGLRKVFSTPDGAKVAVEGLDVCMYEGQIFVLLGKPNNPASVMYFLLCFCLVSTCFCFC